MFLQHVDTHVRKEWQILLFYHLLSQPVWRPNKFKNIQLFISTGRTFIQSLGHLVLRLMACNFFEFYISSELSNAHVSPFPCNMSGFPSIDGRKREICGFI